MIRAASSSSGAARRNYTQVSSTEQGPEAAASTDTAAAAVAASTTTTATTTTTGLNNSNNNATSSSSDDSNACFYPPNDDGRRLNVVILDVAQKKFRVTVHPCSTVQQLKRAGYRVHKVPADRQRLIYRGKMLQDDDNNVTLQSVGIVNDDVIVHLFPKPRVVIKDANTTSQKKKSTKDSNSSNNNDGASTTNSDDDDEEEDEDDTGARVPTIVLDADEAERRSQILVLGSSDYVEAQNNVKLFSFMLLIISTIELMTLLSVALGVQQEENLSGVGGSGAGGSGSTGGSGGGYPYTYGMQDDVLNNLDDGDFRFNNNNNHNNNNNNTSTTYSNNLRGGVVNPNDVVYAQWNLSSWFDLLISLLGVYVAILGIKASSENTHRLAKWYLYGTLLTGVGWMLWNFIMTYEIDVKMNENRQAARNNNNSTNNNNTDDYYYPVLDNDDIFWQAVSVMVLPGMVWFMCCLKAWQFQYLLREAEQEAQERIRSEWSAMEHAANGTTTTTTTTSTTTVSNNNNNDDEELALQHPTATIS